LYSPEYTVLWCGHQGYNETKNKVKIHVLKPKKGNVIARSMRRSNPFRVKQISLNKTFT